MGCAQQNRAQFPAPPQYTGKARACPTTRHSSVPTLGTRCGFLARYSQSVLRPRSTPGPVGLPSDTSFSARYTLGTRKLYRFTGTLAAVATPRQLHGKSIALGPSRAGEPLLPLARYAVNAGQLAPFPSESAHAF